MKKQSLLQVFKNKYRGYLFLVLFLFLVLEILNIYSFADALKKDSEKKLHFLADAISTAVSFQAYENIHEIIATGHFKEEYLAIIVLNKDGEVISRYGADVAIDLFKLKTQWNFMSQLIVSDIISTQEVVGKIVAIYRTDRFFNKVYTDCTIFGIILVVLILVSFYFVKEMQRNLIQPLMKFIGVLESMGTGQEIPYDSQVTIDSHIEEIQELKKKFEKMLQSLNDQQQKLKDSQDSLKNMNKELESLVEQKTAKLNETIENLKSFQNKLIAQEKLASMGTLAAGIAHEIKNPLNLINNSAQLIHDFVNEDLIPFIESSKNESFLNKNSYFLEDVEGVKAACSMIVKNGLRADSIIRNLLAQSKNEKIILEKVSLKNLVEEYFQLSYHSMRAQIGMSVEKLLDLEDVGSFEVVPQNLGRAMANLYENAYYSMQKKLENVGREYVPQIAVMLTKRDEAHVSIIIRDNGLGVPESLKTKVFEPFFTTKPKGEGTGLGLSMVFDIIRSHQGEILIESEEGIFTKIEIILPIKE